MPLQIHTDNGSPFGAVQAVQRLTRLAAWFVEPAREPAYSEPGSPQQNGRHERIHLDLTSLTIIRGRESQADGFELRIAKRFIWSKSGCQQIRYTIKERYRSFQEN